ncbi:VOC family protein [Phenylobacterium sp.]|uniref:VOC family protein n=1 Tax=Phenylobacterium sp. TaxID=1871053 RepID=UPI002FC7C33E
MQLRAIDHINISTPRLAETRDFFMSVLGLTEGFRPDFGVPGHWLYAGDRAIVHLVGTTESTTPSKGGALDHFAFQISDYDAMVATLDKHGVSYAPLDVPGTAIRQLFIRDPNGVQVELNYRPA